MELGTGDTAMDTNETALISYSSMGVVREAYTKSK